MKLFLHFIIWLFISGSLLAQLSNAKIEQLIQQGEFTKAKIVIDEELTKNESLTPLERLDLIFEKERLDRIKDDFNKSEHDVIDYIKQYIPNVSKNDLKKWEDEKSLEAMTIDGEKYYFRNAARNLFRINKECKSIKNRVDNITPEPAPNFIAAIIAEHKKDGKRFLSPARYRIDYKITLHADVVPHNEIVRCWLPFPREIKDKQEDIKILKVFPEDYILSDNSKLQRSIYFEQVVEKDKESEFSISYEYTCTAEYNDINPAKVKPYNKNSEEYIKYTSERAPHLVFTNELKKISAQIVGNEKNPFLIAKRIFEWVDNYAPWASSREYSTIRSLPMYCIENHHGDCGIQTMTFMTLARMNGIPTRWQSGWEPTTMHDWCYMYIEPYGWVPVDQSAGLQNSTDEKIKWFYLGNVHNERLIINDDYSVPLFPLKIYPRSETIDFQTAELEWRGGNLFNNKWKYSFKMTKTN
jgi:transglutaminase-like putative cysteine protease